MSKKRKAFRFMPIIILIIAICLIWGFIEPHFIQIKNYTIANKSIPTQFCGYKICFISDFHISKYSKTRIIEKIILKLQKENIDVLILGGDYVDKYTGDINKLFTPFTTLSVPDGIFAVTGNHDDLWRKKEIILNVFRNNNITVINNKNIKFQRKDSYIELAGVPDFWDTHFSDDQISNNNYFFRILVSHNPDYLIKTEKKFNLGLSGHTHGGQITLFGIWTPLLPIENKKYWRGKYSLQMQDLIISRGIGEVVLPIRFFAPPEISIITLQNGTN